MAVSNMANNGWLNLKAFSSESTQVVPLEEPTQPLNMNSTLGKLLAGTPDDVYIHLSPAKPQEFASGVNQSTYWARFGDVKNLTLLQYKNGVVGPAPGSSPNATTFIISTSDPLAFIPRPSVGCLGITEYVNTWTVKPDATCIVSPTK